MWYRDMYVCIYVFPSVCVHMFVGIDIHPCIYTYAVTGRWPVCTMYVCTCVHKHMCVCIYIFKYEYVYENTAIQWSPT